MKDYLKNYGVITFIALFFIGIIVFFGIDQSNQVVSGKKIDGEDIVFSIGTKDVSTNEYYDEIYDLLGTSTVATLFEMTVADQGIEATEEMKTTAQQLADNTRSSYAAEIGQVEGDKQIATILEAYGYKNGVDDLDDYFLIALKTTTLSEQYIDANAEEVITPYFNELKTRLLSHILVQMDDPKNPTEEELAKMADVDAALSSGTTFGEVAATYSDDTGSAVQNGYLGLSDANTSYVAAFLAASLELEEGETSAWVETEYGFHLIRCDASTFETIKENDPESLYEAILTKTPKIKSLAIWSKAQELGVTFEDPEVEAAVLKFFDITEDVEGGK